MSSPSPERERLHSWKQIADFLGCEPRTAQRYEMQRGLPVHRLPGGGVPKVFAYVDELQTWLDRANAAEPAPAGPEPAPPPAVSVRPGGSWRAWAAGGVAVAALVFLFWPVSVSLGNDPVRLADAAESKLPPLLTDGVSVYFQESRRGRLGLYGIPLSGGIGAPLALALPSPDPGVVSPDGRAMLLRSIQGNKDGDEPLFRQPLPSGAAVRLGEIRAYDSAWTPDGKRIVFSRQRTVYEAAADGTGVRKLFDVPGRAYWFRWDPAGRTVRFTVYDSSRSAYSIWETTAALGAPSPVSFGLAAGTRQCCGAWSPEGDLYFFQASVDGFFHIFGHRETRFPPPGAAVQLTRGASHFRSPVPLPSGGRLLVLQQAQKAEPARFDRALGRWIPLFDGVSAATVAYSPDGKTLAYTRLPDHSLWLCRLPDCTDPRPLLPPPARVTMPRWSPDGARIACMRMEEDGTWRAVVVPASGGGAAVAVPDPRAEADPVWSPDGGRLAFGAAPNPDHGDRGDIRIWNWRTKRIEAVPGSAGMYSPSWSPDGRVLAAIRAGTREIALYDFVAREWSRPLPGVRAGYLQWSAKGERLFFVAGVARGEQAVMALDRAAGTVVPVADFSGLRRPEFSFGDWLGLAPDDSPIALRDLSTEEILSWPIRRN